MKRARALGVLLGVAIVPVLVDCSQSTNQATLRSLERSGQVAFLCIADPTSPNPGRPLDFCHSLPTGSTTPATYDYSVPHVIALVTQTARGEVAVIDVTARTVLDQNPSAPAFNFIPVGQIPTSIVTTPASTAAFVSVADPSRPGIFALPTSKVLPGSFTGLPLLTSFPACALPSPPGAMVLLNDPLRIPDDPSTRRAHCPGSLSTPAENPSGAGYALTLDNESYGTPKLVVALPDRGELAVIDAQELLNAEPGSFAACPIEKLVPLSSRGVEAFAAGTGAAGVSATNDGGSSALPVAPEAGETQPIGATDGAFADGASADGASADGAVEDGAFAEGAVADGGAADSAVGDRALADALAESAPVRSVVPSRAGAVCVAPTSPGHAHVAAGTPARPSGLAYSDDGRLFVSDENLPMIHVLSAEDPCSMSETAPLVATSAAEPSRAIVTTSLAVSPLTHTAKRYLYAVDLLDSGSVMVFDVSEGSTTRTPLSLVAPAYSLTGEPDRISFGAPVQALTFVRHDVPLVDLAYPNGVLSGGLCDPTNASSPYSAQSASSSTTTNVTSSTAPAHPSSLRGVFAFAALTSGSLRIIDVDDLDAPCRRPNNSNDPRLGCSGPLSDEAAPVSLPVFPAASNEISCQAVVAHQPRSSQYIFDAAGVNQSPTMQTLPLLRNRDGTVLSIDPTVPGSEIRPRLLGPLMQDPTSKNPSAIKSYLTQVGAGLGTEILSACPYDNFQTSAGQTIPAPPGCDPTAQPPAASNWVAFDVRELRVHHSEDWSITYEGTIPGFGAHIGQFSCSDPNKSPDECEYGGDGASYVFRDTAASFCNSGIFDRDLGGVSEIGSTDLIQIIDPIPASDDAYWGTTNNVCDYGRCLSVYGTAANPGPGRERPIREAYQDRVVLESEPVYEDPDRKTRPLPVTCCFPYPVMYFVRGKEQWIVFGSVTGFVHNVVPDPTSSDPATARCRYADTACNPSLALRNSRVRTRERVQSQALRIPGYDDPSLFRNMQMQFTIWAPPDIESCPQSVTATGSCLERDMNFKFSEIGGYKSMSNSLSASSVSPQSILYVPTLDKLAIPDGISSGLLMFDVSKLVVTDSFL